MMIQQSTFVEPGIERLINEIRQEDSRFDRELRSAHREKIVLPVRIKFLNGEEDVECFSRNISATGICLLSEASIEVDTQCMLKIERLNEKISDVMAVCRWSRAFGPTHSISGWQFLRLSARQNG